MYPDNKEKSKEFFELQDAYDQIMNWPKEKPHFEGTQKVVKLFMLYFISTEPFDVLFVEIYLYNI